MFLVVTFRWYKFVLFDWSFNLHVPRLICLWLINKAWAVTRTELLLSNMSANLMAFPFCELQIIPKSPWMIRYDNVVKLFFFISLTLYLGLRVSLLGPFEYICLFSSSCQKRLNKTQPTSKRMRKIEPQLSLSLSTVVWCVKTLKVFLNEVCHIVAL